MKIRSELELAQFLDNELAWRKKELINIKGFVDKQKEKRTEQTMLRCAVMSLYAHWEGFIKEAGKAYLFYIFFLEKKYTEINNNLIALSLKKRFSAHSDINSFQLYKSITDFFLLDTAFDIIADSPNIDFEIDTKSNLNPQILKDLINKLGFDYNLYETKEKPVIDKLLEIRNKVAHGNKEYIDYESYIFLHDEVFGLINLFKNQIDNAISTKFYLK